jgi:hypothetical protein
MATRPLVSYKLCRRSDVDGPHGRARRTVLFSDCSLELVRTKSAKITKWPVGIYEVISSGSGLWRFVEGVDITINPGK